MRLTSSAEKRHDYGDVRGRASAVMIAVLDGIPYRAGGKYKQFFGTGKSVEVTGAWLLPYTARQYIYFPELSTFC